MHKCYFSNIWLQLESYMGQGINRISQNRLHGQKNSKSPKMRIKTLHNLTREEKENSQITLNTKKRFTRFTKGSAFQTIYS